MEDVTKLKISNVEKERLLIKNLNNRPNAMATYGQAKMSSAETKEVFDKQFELAVERHNNLCDKVENLDETVTGFLDGTEGEERKRRLSEMNRQTEETARVAAEESRVANEQTRQDNEQTRIANENERDSYESERQDEEKKRQDAEANRGQQFGDVKDAVQRILWIQRDLEEGRLDTLLGSITHMQGGWYNGNDANTNELVFDFVPKVIIIVENVLVGGNYKYEGLGVIFPEGECILRFTSYSDSPIGAYVNNDEVTVTLEDQSVKLISTVGSSDDIFNVQSINDHDEVVIDESDGYGYWYYAFG